MDKRKTRSDKKTRVNPPLDRHTHALLCRLALACGVSKTALAEQIIYSALRSTDFVNHLQSQNSCSEFRVIPIIINGQIRYMDSDSK